jgi:leader peptidase (prepilin peptidase)/N-methyltransferase
VPAGFFGVQPVVERERGGPVVVLQDMWGMTKQTAVALLAFYVILALINPSGLGLGDVKLSGALGALLGWLGWPAVLAGTLAAFALNAVVALVLLASRRVTAKSGIAFGPAMILGAVLGAAYWVARSTALAG